MDIALSPLRPMSGITRTLFVGNYGNAAELAVSNKNDIEAVLCFHVFTEHNPQYNLNPDIVYHNVPFLDGYEVAPEIFEDAMKFALSQHEQKKTMLFHCAAGYSRSIVMAATFLHVADVMPFDAALSRCMLVRREAQPHPAIVRSARKWLKIYPYDGSYETSET